MCPPEATPDDPASPIAADPHDWQSLVMWASRGGQGALVRLCCVEAPFAGARRREQLVRARTCLGQMPLAIPFELLAAGAQRVVLDASGCADPDGQARLFHQIVEIADVHGLVKRVVVDDKPRASAGALDAGQMPVVRRRLLLGLGRTDPGSDVSQPELEQSWHRRLRNAIRALAGTGRPSPDSDATQTATAPALELTSAGCTACGVCTWTCPEEALSLAGNEDGLALTYDASKCVGCSQCLSACPEAALTSEGRLGWGSLLAEPVAIEEMRSKTCGRCRTRFVPGAADAAFCATCSYRRENPFGSAMPPWLLDSIARGKN